jgi:hypothetical protein
LVVALGGLLQEHVWEHRLRRKTNDLLIMRSGAVNCVLNPPATAFWLPLTRFTICDQLVLAAANW